MRDLKAEHPFESVRVLVPRTDEGYGFTAPTDASGEAVVHSTLSIQPRANATNVWGQVALLLMHTTPLYRLIAMASTQRTIPAKPPALKDRILNDEPVSFEEYLERDASDERRLEFYDGWIINVTGANWNHNVIALNLGGIFLEKRLRSGCQPVAGDMRVAYGNEGKYLYPDIAVCCGTPQLEKHAGVDMLFNPTCIAEVLSSSTADYDQGPKFHRYRQIDTLQTYFVVAQDEPKVTIWARGDDDSWTMRDISGLDASFLIEEIGISIEMRQLYSNVFDSTS